jgi:N utilization substance protein B
MQVDKRTQARELAMQALHQLDVQGSELLGRLHEDFFNEFEQDEQVRKLAADWTKGAWENLGDCDELIAAATIGWDLARLTAVDKSVLRLAVYQLRFCPDIPPKAAINEAIELAKKYSTEKSGPFVNGVLDAVLRKLSSHRP